MSAFGYPWFPADTLIAWWWWWWRWVSGVMEDL